MQNRSQVVSIMRDVYAESVMLISLLSSLLTSIELTCWFQCWDVPKGEAVVIQSHLYAVHQRCLNSGPLATRDSAWRSIESLFDSIAHQRSADILHSSCPWVCYRDPWHFDVWSDQGYTAVGKEECGTTRATLIILSSDYILKLNKSCKFHINI